MSEKKATRHVHNQTFKVVVTPRPTSATGTPPPPRNMYVTGTIDSNVSGTVTVLEPTPLPPLSSVSGEIEFVGKIPSRSECRIGTPLAVAALTPRPCKCAESDSETASDLFDRGVGFIVGLFSGERESGTHSTSRDRVSDVTAGTGAHRHRWFLPNYCPVFAVYRDIR